MELITIGVTLVSGCHVDQSSRCIMRRIEIEIPCLFLIKSFYLCSWESLMKVCFGKGLVPATQDRAREQVISGSIIQSVLDAFQIPESMPSSHFIAPHL